MYFARERILRKDLVKIGLLGCGGFGAVEMYEHKARRTDGWTAHPQNMEIENPSTKNTTRTRKCVILCGCLCKILQQDRRPDRQTDGQTERDRRADTQIGREREKKVAL